ncbi:MAG: replication initiator protein [Microviridae sp.]|nr:MAG: replication initiator protein [Microviridae sp.]
MPCYSPIKGYRDSSGNLFFHSKPGTNIFKVPCGQCVGCRLERSRQWAARCMNEASLHAENCFITLTYRDAPQSLDYRDFQLFMKRLRKHFPKVRFYMCGEYGEEGNRPHFHACLFGINFPDRVKFSRSLYRSPTLERLWPHGFSSIGEVTFESAAYVARYIMKKVTGDIAEQHYSYVDPDTGEVLQRVPEFSHMSLKPGIGAGWLDKYRSDVYPNGDMVVRGVESKAPRYYDKLYRRHDFQVNLNHDLFEELKAKRRLNARLAWRDSLDSRLVVRRKVAESRIKRLKRSTF